MKLAPVVLFVYNRPEHTRQTLEALKGTELAERSDLIVYSDGPRDEAAVEAVGAVRSFLRNIIGFKSVTIVESERNRGLANSVIAGVTEIVNRFGRVIVLEDDLVTSSGFLTYMNKALDRYADEEKVMQISGHMFDVDIDAETNAVFLPFISSWGWATWKRAWDHFDPLMGGYDRLKNDRKLRKRFNLDGAYGYFGMLKAQRNGKVDSWAIRWYLSVFIRGGLVLYPVSSFVENIGFDGSGVHCGSSMAVSFGSQLLVGVEEVNESFPDVLVDKDAYTKVRMFLLSSARFVDRLKNWLTILS